MENCLVTGYRQKDSLSKSVCLFDNNTRHLLSKINDIFRLCFDC